MEQAPLTELQKTLEDTSKTLKQLTCIEHQKANAATQKQHMLMDDFLKEEQALILKLRGLDQRRNKLTKELGFDGLSFREILKQADDHTRSELSPFFNSMAEEIRILKQAKESSDRIIKLRLREMESVLSGNQGSNYESSGGLSKSLPSHFKDTYV